MRLFYSLLVSSILSITVFAQTSVFRVQIFVQTGDNYAAQHYLGVSPQNTIGLDTNRNLQEFREILLPPQPPTYPFSSRFRTIPGRPSTPLAGLGNGVENDYRSFVDTIQVDSFKIEITGDSLETNPTTISWGGGLNTYAGEWKIKPQTGSDFPETNMLTTSFVTFPAGPISRSAIIIKKGARITTSVDDIKNLIPERFALEQNFPNPFNPETKIRYALPNTERVSLKVYDMLGKEIATLVNQVQPQGYYSIVFNGSALSSGIYFYRFQSSSFISVKRMILIK